MPRRRSPGPRVRVKLAPGAKGVPRRNAALRSRSHNGNTPIQENDPVSVQQVLDLIGNTPLVEITRMDAGPCRLFLKLESQNPGGSIKDRIGRSMIEAAEKGA